MAGAKHLNRLTHDALAMRAGLRAAGAKSMIMDDLVAKLSNSGREVNQDCALTTRLKSTESIRNKMIKKQDQYKDASDMTDYLGAKVIVRDEKEAYEYMRFLQSEYETMEVSRELYSDPKHVCNMLKADLMIKGHRVEVQVQNAFDYYVHELEHNVVYKNPRMTFSIDERNMFVDSIRDLVKSFYRGNITKIRMEPDPRVLDTVIKMVDDYIDKNIKPRMEWRGRRL